jgi:hypothetical protein
VSTVVAEIVDVHGERVVVERIAHKRPDGAKVRLGFPDRFGELLLTERQLGALAKVLVDQALDLSMLKPLFTEGPQAGH